MYLVMYIVYLNVISDEKHNCKHDTLGQSIVSSKRVEKKYCLKRIST